MEKSQQTIPFQKETEEVLIEFNKALRAINFYPPGHSALKPVLKRAYETLIKYLYSQSILPLTIKREGFFFREAPIGRVPALLGLANEFFLRRVRSVQFLRTLEPKEFTTILKMLTEKPEQLIANGGSERYVFSRGVKNIILNEIRYEDFRLEEDKHLEEGELAEIGEEEEQEGENILSLDFALTEEEEEVLKLLNQIETLYEPNAYIQVLKLLVGKTKLLLVQNKLEVAFRVLTALARHFIEPKRPREVKPYISEGLKTIADERTIPIIVNRLCSPDIKDPSDLINLLIIIGESVLTTLIVRLSTEKDLRSRKRLMLAIIRFKDKALPRLLPFLDDNRWYVVRNVVSILGEMQLPESVPHLGKILDYPDVRVQKEIIKTLSKIKTKESVEILLMLLFKKSSPEIRSYAAYALGVVRETFAIPYFIKILKGKNLYFEDLNFLKEVILALGRIGSYECFTPLVKLFKKRSLFFSKRFRFLKGVISQALGELGGEDAIQLLFDCAVKSRGDLRETCFNVISQIAERFELTG
jgi:HEAT repeat protein